MRARTTALLGVGVLVLAAGCAGPQAGGPPGTGPQDASDETPLVGVAMPSVELERWVGDGENVSAQLTSLGFDVDMRYAEDDPATQVEQLRAMVDAGADALVVASVDGSALSDVLADAGAADIPVIAYDRLISGTDAVDYYASFDNHRVGVLQGTALLRGLGVVDAAGKPTGAAGPFAVELFAGSPDDNNATVFWDGAMSVLRPYLDSGVLTVPSGQVQREQGAIQGWAADLAGERMTSLLGPYRDGLRLDGVLSPYDGISQAILAATAELGYVPVVTGQDAELDAVRSVAAGEQYATVYKDTRQLAEVTVQMVQALLDGGEPEVNDTTSYDNGVKVVPAYLLAPQEVTEDSYTKVLVDSGYYTAQELR
ncbi:substrate-binding domain-containing protein [Puerhibacterium sp. TATVAM-FAB25]|uniref:substrate-binding domain-containing protein n=1 Tax=Puerhibacterium sp. TATVAM-FAB25 TaxID=3093699 RepID=UPI00397CE2B7